MTAIALMTEIETILDQSSVEEILGALADVCFEKADHLRCNWEDETTGRVWEHAGDALYDFLSEQEERLP